MLYAGSMITKGRANGVVTAIAQQTEVGKIASLLASSDVTKTLLMVKMERFSLNISKIIAIAIVLIVLVGIYQETPLREIFFLSVAIAVSTIPEGLPVAITIALSVDSFVGDVDENVLLAAVLCNEANFNIEDGEISFIGDQIDVALAKYAFDKDASLYELQKETAPVNIMPYEPENKFSGVVYKIDAKQQHFIKGSPEVILQKCSLSEEDKESITASVNEWASKGFRNIALAYKESDENDLAKDNYVFLGFAAIFNKIMISRVFVGGLYMGVNAFAVFYTLLQFGYEEDMARNITLLLMVLFENVYVLNSRSETNSIFKIDHSKNRFLWVSIIIAQGVHIASTHIPFMQSVVNIQSVNLEMWSMLLAIAVGLMGVMEIEKLIRKKLHDR